MMILKIVAYYLFSSRGFNQFIKPFAHIFLKIKSSESQNNQFTQIILTVDCESGYLKTNNQRVWMFQEPQAFQGYYSGINNILDLLKRYNIRATFFLSTQCFSSAGNIKKVIIRTLTRIINEGHELGLHLHPKEDSSLKSECGIDFSYTGAKYYDNKTVELMITKSMGLINKYLGRKITDSICSIRWANFSFDLNKVKTVSKYFRIDSSICPGCSGHNNDDRKFDWSNYYKYDVHKIGNVIEVPLSTFRFLGWRPADPSLGILTEVALNKYIETNISPFVLLTHSSECIYGNGKPSYVLSNLERFIQNNQKKNIEYVTINEVSFD